MPVRETSDEARWAAIRGDNTAGGDAVVGVSTAGIGVRGVSDSSTGVVGTSKTWQGVHGASETRSGVLGESKSGRGVHGTSDSSTGVNGESKTGRGVHAVSRSGVGLEAEGGRVAGLFKGSIEVSGDVRLTSGADCAEDFDIEGPASVVPGTVMVMGPDGALRPSAQPYDKRVVGVVSGGGGLPAAIVLDRHEVASNRQPIALLGKVYCNVDAQHAAIDVGDLLTTSDVPGRAMKVADLRFAQGAVIGKALAALPDGQGTIPMLIALQ